MSQSAAFLAKPNKEEQGALVSSAFLVDGAIKELRGANLSALAFPDPLFQVLYQFVSAEYDRDPRPILSEVGLRDQVISVVSNITGESPAHAANMWKQILHWGAQVTKTEFRTLLTRFEQYHKEEGLKVRFGETSEILSDYVQGKGSIHDVSAHIEKVLGEVNAVKTLQVGTPPDRWMKLSAGIGELEGQFISTGFHEWDRLITKSGTKMGQPLGSIHFVSAPAGHGKSTLLRSLLKQQCFGHNTPTCYINYEISEREFVEDMFASVMSMSPYRKWDWINKFEAETGERTSAIAKWDGAKLAFAKYMEEISTKKIFDVIHHMAFELEDIKALIESRHAAGYKVFMIDTINRVMSKEAKGQRHDELAHIIYSLEQQALRLNCVIVCAAQENREKWKRVDKTPTVADLAGASAIEKAAYSVSQLYRADYYTGGQVDYSEIIITKARGHGAGKDMRVRVSFAPNNHCYVPYKEGMTDKVVVGSATTLPPSGGAVISGGAHD